MLIRGNEVVCIFTLPPGLGDVWNGSATVRDTRRYTMLDYAVVLGERLDAVHFRRERSSLWKEEYYA